MHVCTDKAIAAKISNNFNFLILFPTGYNIQRTLNLNTFTQQVYTNLYHQIVYFDILGHLTFLFKWFQLSDTLHYRIQITKNTES